MMFSMINFYHLNNDLSLYLASNILAFFLIVMVHLAIPILAITINNYDSTNSLDSEKF